MNFADITKKLLIATTVLLSVSLCAIPIVNACPFCASVGLTFTDQMASKDVVVSAKLLEIPEVDEDDDELPRALFEIEDVLRGNELVKPGMKFRALLVGRYPVGEKFFVMGVDPPRLKWTTPMKASDRVLDYLGQLDSLPEKGADRLAFFQEFFEDEESILAFDAYDEFAKAPYEDLIALKDRMDRERLISLINNDKTSPNRRRLYFTMLGVCGKAEDADMLAELITSGSRKKMRGLEALIACYLNLKGEAGMDLIQKEFFANKDTEFTYTMLAMQALRFHAEETDIIPKRRIIEAARVVLDNEEARDLVIPDLARWEDWSVMEKLVKIFKESGEDNNWIRVPIASYLMACPLPAAKKHIADLEKLDASSIARARFLDGDDFDDFDDEEEDENDSEETDSGAGDSDSSGRTTSDQGLRLFRDSLGSAQFVSMTDTDAIRDDDANQEQATISRHVVRKVEQPSVSDSELNLPDASNPVEQTFVSRKSESNQPRTDQVARSVVPPSVVAAPIVASTPNLTWQIVFIPMGVSIILFVLLWSVLSGWFERLIF